MKYRPWASILAISLCLTGISGCVGSRRAAETSDDTQTVEVVVNGQTTSISINVEEIGRTHQTYSKSIEKNLMEPLRKIAEQPAEARTREFVESVQLNPAAVDKVLGTFLASVGTPLVQLQQLGATNFQVEQGSPVDSLRVATEAAEDIRARVVSPLLPEEGTPYSAADLFITSESGAEGLDPQSIIENIQRNIPNDVSVENSPSIADSINPEFIGQYGETTFGAVNGFVESKNTLIESSVNSISSLTASSESGEGDVPEPNFLSLAALLLGLANTAGLFFLFYRLFNREKADDDKAKNAAIDTTANSQTSFNRKDRIIDTVSSNVKTLQHDYDLLKQEFQNLSRQIGIIHSEREQSIAQNQQKTVESPHHLSDVGRTTPSMTVRAGSSRRGRAQPTTYDPPQATPRALSSAEIYNQNPESFERVATVAVSESSQQKLWVGKKVTPTFSQRAQGDYWVITQDKQTFYLVIKDQASINENNLVTLGIIYQFESGSNLSSLRRKYSNLAEVTPQGNEWLLKSSGSLVFY